LIKRQSSLRWLNSTRVLAIGGCPKVLVSPRHSPACSTKGAVPLPVDPLLPAHDILAVAAEAGARLVVLVSADRIPALTGLEAKPPVLINGPRGGWAAALRLRQAENSPAAY
jgi:hypothetical protein